MPGSFPVFDAAVGQILHWLDPATALDIGAGAGKFGRLLRDQVPRCRTTALEVEPAYVERYRLATVYASVEIADALSWCTDQADACFDVVILGDCIEHMPKGEALDLLNLLMYRSAWVLVLAPEFIVQGAVGGVASEVHRSVWSERDLGWHDLWAWDNTRAMSMFLLRGYRPSPVTIDEIVRRVNAGNLPLHDFDGQTVVRPFRLRMVDHSREVSYRAR